MEESASAQRTTQRFNYAYIALKYKKNLYWFWVKAINWSEGGFCFFSDSKFQVGAELHFKKAKDQFKGIIRWEKKDPDQHTLLNMALNRLIVDKAYQIELDRDWDDLILKHLRSADLDQKIDFVEERLDIKLSKDKIASLMALNSWKDATCYGVQCDGDIWREFVDVEVQKTNNPKELDDQVAKWTKYFE